MALPRTYNNPFAIIQQTPSPWQGLKGSTNSGFLIFDSPKWGVRAGFINLVNTYLNRGLNTIAKIFPVYAPLGHGANDPEAYARYVSQRTGIGLNTPITTRDQLRQIGFAITIVEEGADWVPRAEFEEGFKLAMEARPWPSGSTVQQAGMGAGALLLIAGGIYYWYQNYRA